MRHGEALSKQEAGVHTDVDRPLSASGIEAVTHVAHGLTARGLKPDRVLSSPLLRAKQTAEMIARQLDCADRIEICQALHPGQDPVAFVETLRQLHVEGTILAVGHQPSLGRLAAYLVFGEPRDGIALRPAGVCALDLPEFPRSLEATLRALWDPEIFAKLSRDIKLS